MVREDQVISRPDAPFLYPKSKRHDAAEVDIVHNRLVRVHLALDKLQARESSINKPAVV
jgi:hypothetical protein